MDGSHRTLLALGLLLAGACATPELEKEEPPPPPPIDFDALCGDDEAPTWDTVSFEGHADMGPCGHLLISEGASMRMLHPDGSEELFDELLSSPRFAHTGHLAAWYRAGLMLELRELASDQTRSFVGPFDKVGFVRSLEDGVGARLFTCGAALSLHTFDAEADEDLGPVICQTVVTATYAPLLAYSTEAGQLYLANADSGTRTRITTGLSADPGAFDRVGLDHDGRLVLYFNYTVDVPTNQWLVDETELYTAEGDYLGTLAGEAVLYQGSEPGAPPFLHSEQDGLAVVRKGELVVLHGSEDLAEVALAGDTGDMLVATTDHRILRYAATNPSAGLELASLDVDAYDLEVSRLGMWSTWTYSEGCADEFCDYFATQTQRWSSVAGLAETFESLIFSDAYVLFDEGTLLSRNLISIDVSAVPEANPTQKVRLVNPGAKVVQTFTPTTMDATLIADWLPDNRALVRFDVEGDEQLAVVGAFPPSVETIGQPTRYDEVMVDARGRIGAARRSQDDRIYWGALP